MGKSVLLAVGAIALLAGCSEQSHWPKPNAFNVPAIYLGCMEIEVGAGESFGNFDVYQPVHFTVDSGAMLHDVYAAQGCVFKETVLVSR